MSAVPAVSTEFSFDEWVRLWQADPAAAEARRRAEIQVVIDSTTEYYRERLLRLQWRIDQEISRHKTPLGATAALTRMMMDRYAGSLGLYYQITGPLEDIRLQMLEMHAMLLKLGATVAEGAKSLVQQPAEKENP